jgi:hypothetical protein
MEAKVNPTNVHWFEGGMDDRSDDDVRIGSNDNRTRGDKKMAYLGANKAKASQMQTMLSRQKAAAPKKTSGNDASSTSTSLNK